MAKKSNTMLVRKGVTVVRDGKRVRPEIGKTFDFEGDEIETITAVDPTALGDPKSEEPGKAETASVETAPPANAGTSTAASSSAEGSQTGAQGGTKTPTANVSDAEAAAGKTGDDDL